MRVFVFGDSITQGFYDSAGGWVARIANKKHMSTLSSIRKGSKDIIEVFNLGVSGDTAAGVANRMRSEVEARRLYDSEGPDVVVIAVGINDAILVDNRAQMDVYVFQENYESIISAAKELQTRVVCIGLTAVDESKTDPWIGSSSAKQWKNNRINLFEDTIKQSANILGAEFIGVHDAFLQELDAGKHLLADGLHPNDAGHLWLYELITKNI